MNENRKRQFTIKLKTPFRDLQPLIDNKFQTKKLFIDNEIFNHRYNKH